MEVNPYTPPRAEIGDPASAREKALQIAAPYRGLVLWFGLQLVAGFGGVLAIALVDPDLRPVFQTVRMLASLGTTVGLVIYAYRTARALGSNVAVLWAIAMIVPLVNLITLLILSLKATRACREAGIPVGFLGPKRVREAGTS